MATAELFKPLPAPIQRGKFRTVDAEAHIDPPHTFWAEYLPMHLKEFAPAIEEGDECDFVVFEGRKRPLVMLANQAGCTGQDFKIMGKLADLHDSVIPSRRLAVMDEDGVDVEVLYGGGPLVTGNSELYIESYRANNRWLGDCCNYDKNRLAGVAFDDALAETINGLYRAEVIHQRFLEPIGNILSAKAEQRYDAMLEDVPVAAQLKPIGLRQSWGGSL